MSGAPPINMLLCVECEREFPAKMDEQDPLCFTCERADQELAARFAAGAQARITQSRIPVVEHQVPVEFARHDPRPFGLGFAEIPSSKLTQALAEDRRGHGDAYFALFALACVYVLLGAVVLAIAAVR